MRLPASTDHSGFEHPVRWNTEIEQSFRTHGLRGSSARRELGNADEGGQGGRGRGAIQELPVDLAGADTQRTDTRKFQGAWADDGGCQSEKRTRKEAGMVSHSPNSPQGFSLSFEGFQRASTFPEMIRERSDSRSFAENSESCAQERRETAGAEHPLSVTPTLSLTLYARNIRPRP